MSAHETVMRWVTDELASGRLHIGDHLPGERTLAEQLGISRSSLRETLRVLEALGTLQSSTGSGPRAGTIVIAAPEQALSLALTMQLATKQVTHEQVVQIRLLLEAWAARSSNVALGDWEEAERILDHMDDPELGVPEFLRLDAQFHVHASRSCGNPMIATLMEALRMSIGDHTVELASNLPDWAATSERLRSEHRDILEALRTGDGEGAATRLEQHIRGYFEETQRAR